MSKTGELAEKIDRFVGRDGDGSGCRGISDAACEEVGGNFFKQTGAMIASKSGDALSKPGLILAWMLTALGAPAITIGLLAPVREAGSLLPQLAIAQMVRRSAVRKWFWVFGSVFQALAVAGMGAAGLFLEGETAGWAIVGLVACFSLARGVCSISSKDLLGKTIPKKRRGRLGGIASSIAGFAAVGVGLFFSTRAVEDVGIDTFSSLLFLAAGLWLVGAGLMAWVKEPGSETEPAKRSSGGVWSSLGLLKTNPEFRRFCIARAMLASTVLSMPFYVVLAHEATGGRIASLGILMVAGSLATAISGLVWGQFADQSSRKTMAVAGGSAGVVGVATAGLSGIGFGEGGAIWVYGALFFLLGIAHTGIRLGRKTYLVDMANEENRATYVAVSNTLIGVVLLASGSFGLLADAIGERGVVLAFGILGIAGGVYALVLPEAGEAEA